MAPLVVRLAGTTTPTITAVPLTASAFRPFGDVIANPQPSVHASTFTRQASTNGGIGGVLANQGTSVKYPSVTALPDLYALGAAPSGKQAEVAVSVFVCAKRKLERDEDGNDGVFSVRILERHPFTTQIFIPLSSTSTTTTASTSQTNPPLRYLVVVAPSLPPSQLDASLPVPPPSTPSTWRPPLPGRGLPDLSRIRAFVATDRQAVAYGPGTWHAPMVALDTTQGAGRESIEFVVVQLANGVGVEDCQEVVFSDVGEGVDATGLGGTGARVRVAGGLVGGNGLKAKL